MLCWDSPPLTQQRNLSRANGSERGYMLGYMVIEVLHELYGIESLQREPWIHLISYLKPFKNMVTRLDGFVNPCDYGL